MFIFRCKINKKKITVITKISFEYTPITELCIFPCKLNRIMLNSPSSEKFHSLTYMTEAKQDHKKAYLTMNASEN